MAKNAAYDLAVEKIEAARRSGATRLKLSGKLNGNDSDVLTELPESLGRLEHLQTLDLRSNELFMLPDSIGHLEQLQALYLNGNRLSSLPESLCKLKRLQTLYLSNNHFDVLPESLTQLSQLQTLYIGDNQLRELPESLGQMTQLRTLYLTNNRIRSLPESLGRLTQLQTIYLANNELDALPDTLVQLPQLCTLYLSDNRLSVLPESIGQLAQLQILELNGNQLVSLPDSIGHLANLVELSLDRNPLAPELAAASLSGFSSVMRFLREIAKGGRSRYEAKLLILGDGNEGKTCVSRALRGLKFTNQEGTRGVDVEQWKFSHPSMPDEHISLNIWDFEGQEIAHQTHQFFLTSQALYLIVFRCRDQFQMDRAEYWLHTIRARAPEAKVVIVVSQCEIRSPHIPLDRIQAEYGDWLSDVWYFPVGCQNGKNVDALQAYLRQAAAELPFMGEAWPMTYERAEDAIKRKRKPYINRAQLDRILKKSGISPDNYSDAAGAMARIGAITEFPACPELRDFVVLKPQWLTKGISQVMENGQLSEDQGEISLSRMELIWSNARYQGMFPAFYSCMKEFELCYDLDDVAGSCLVPLRFGYIAPLIPWNEESEVKVRRMEYKLNIRPPMGIMSRFIVKMHHMIVKTEAFPKGIYWHNGVFLQTHSPCPSQALCEFVPDKWVFRVQVRAAFPQAMCEQIHAYIKAVLSFFTGLSAERSFGCIKVDPQTDEESNCTGLHTERRIYTAISKERETLDCEFEDHEVDPRRLVWGISSFGGFVEERIRDVFRNEMDQTPRWAKPLLPSLESLLQWADSHGEQVERVLSGQEQLAAEFKQESESKLREYLAYMNEMLDDRDHTSAPGLIAISAKDRSAWNPARFFNTTFILTPFCESEGNVHPCADGAVEFTKSQDWWRASQTWIARATKLLAAGLTLGFAGVPLAVGAEVAREIEDQVKFMQALTKHVALEVPDDGGDARSDRLTEEVGHRDMRPNERELAITRSALSRFLEQVAPDNYRARRWGSLRRVRMPDLSYRWLCESCARQVR